jgi:rubrerythrin
MAHRVKNALLREKFRLLADEEKKHKDILENFFALLYRAEKMTVPPRVDERLLPAVVVRPSSSLVEILEQAMTAEKAARDFYASLARRVRAARKKILQYLSGVERTHFLMLRGEYTLALQFEDYAEKDIDKVVT